MYNKLIEKKNILSVNFGIFLKFDTELFFKENQLSKKKMTMTIEPLIHLKKNSYNIKKNNNKH